jgi:hypothetical protein
MSVAPEDPPIVVIPRHARLSRRAGKRHMRSHLRAVPTGVSRCSDVSAVLSMTSGVCPVALVRPEPLRHSHHDLPLKTIDSYRVEFVSAQNPSAPIARAPQVTDSRSGDTGTVRLTVRGRVAVVAFVGVIAAAVVLIAYLCWPGSATSSEVPVGGAVTVHQGDTLWSIAQAVYPNSDPRAVVARIISLNHLPDATLVPGETLKVQ